MASSLSSSPLEAFSDGVFAVITTIMVLELKVPNGHSAADAEVLRENAKILAVYLLSFVQVGIYWVNHHYLMDDLETVSHGILWANLGALFMLSLIPFGVEWIGSRGLQPVPVAVYCVCFSLPALAWVVLSRVVTRRTGVPTPAGVGKQLVSALLNFAAIAVAFVSPVSALLLIAIVAILWLIPPRSIVEKSRVLGRPNTSSHHSS